MTKKTHWEEVYATKLSAETSWHQERAGLSLEFIERTGVGRSCQIVDIGGGASPLAGNLRELGFKNVTVLDISGKALRVAQDRLGADAPSVTWIEADITTASLPENHFEVWHDRAVFHFLVEAEDRRRYVETLKTALKPGGHVIVATFELEGPSRCSGLEIVRYSPESLHTELGNHFDLREIAYEIHETPFNTEQKFVYCHFVKI